MELNDILSPEQYFAAYGHVFYNPAPIVKRETVIGGKRYPFGSQGVQVCGKWYVIEPKKTLGIPPHEPNAILIRRAIETHLGKSAGIDMGIRMFDWQKIFSGSKEEAQDYINGLDREGREAIVEGIDLVVTQGLEAINEYRTGNGRKEVGLRFDQKLLLKYRDKILEGLEETDLTDKGLQEKQIDEMQHEPVEAASLRVDMPKAQLLKRAKKLGAKGLHVRLSAQEIIDRAFAAEEEAREAAAGKPAAAPDESEDEPED